MQAAASSSASVSPGKFVWWALAIQEFLIGTLADHDEQGPKMLELTRARCAVACPDIDADQDPAFATAAKFRQAYWEQPNFTDYRARKHFTQKLHDWTDNSKANPIRPGRKTTVLSELSAKVPKEILPFVVLPDVGDADCTLFGHLERVKTLNAEKATADSIKAQAEIDRCMHVCVRACMCTCGRAGGRAGGQAGGRAGGRDAPESSNAAARAGVRPQNRAKLATFEGTAFVCTAGGPCADLI